MQSRVGSLAYRTAYDHTPYGSCPCLTQENTRIRKAWLSYTRNAICKESVVILQALFTLEETDINGGEVRGNRGPY